MTVSILLYALGIALSLVLGMAFSAMESTSLALNRARLLALFGDDELEETSEQEIFRDTKDVYFVSRFGLCTTLVLAGFCAENLLAALVREANLLSGEFVSGPYFHIFTMALTLVGLTPVYLFCVFGLPRFLFKSAAPEESNHPQPWMRFFISVVHPLALLSRLSAVFPIRHLLPRYHLTKNELVALVTDLEVDEAESSADLEEDDGEGRTRSPRLPEG